MFIASPGYVLLSSDYSAQEPRLTAHMSQDEKMIKAYQDGKDVYCEIASLAFNKPYDECKEFNEKGEQSKEGKQRRTQAKSIVLGICYGRGIPSIAEQLNCSVKKAQSIYDSVLSSFPGLNNFTIESENMAREFGYVETVWGRKRRLPDMQLPKYEFTNLNNQVEFDPLNFEDTADEVSERDKIRYTNLLENAYGNKKRQYIITQAQTEGIKIKDNSGYIAKSTRQCVNSRVQGSAADESKKAMILVGENERLKELGFKLLIPVHDELIGECPEENAKEVGELFSSLMVKAAEDLCVPSKCDVEVTRCWYGEEIKI